MNKFDSIEAALDYAIEMELTAYEFYIRLSKQAMTAAMSEAFKRFASEELGHKAKLEAMKAGKKIPKPERVTDLRIADYTAEIKPSPDMDYQEALLLAIQNEKCAYRLYSDLAGEVDDPDLKEVFSMLAAEEVTHKQRFEIEYEDYVLIED